MTIIESPLPNLIKKGSRETFKIGLFPNKNAYQKEQKIQYIKSVRDGVLSMKNGQTYTEREPYNYRPLFRSVHTNKRLFI